MKSPLEIKQNIAKNIYHYRKKANLTQKQLAELLGVKNTAVSNWEKGQNSIDIETLFKACEIFGIPISDMYDTPIGSTAYPPKQKEKTAKEDGLSDAQCALIQFARTVPEDKAELVLRVMKSILGDGG